MSTDYQDLTFLNGANAPFMAELYARYLDDPATVDDSWRAYFDQLLDEAGMARHDADSLPRRALLGVLLDGRGICAKRSGGAVGRQEGRCCCEFERRLDRGHRRLGADAPL